MFSYTWCIRVLIETFVGTYKWILWLNIKGIYLYDWLRLLWEPGVNKKQKQNKKFCLKRWINIKTSPCRSSQTRPIVSLCVLLKQRLLSVTPFKWTSIISPRSHSFFFYETPKVYKGRRRKLEVAVQVQLELKTMWKWLLYGCIHDSWPDLTI